MKKIITIILIFVLLLSTTSLAATKIIKDNDTYIIEDYQRFNNGQQSKVALALTGGGARGLFNIGVIKALEEENIPIDMIVGTSMGSIIGTMYGSGLSISQIEELVTKSNFAKLFDINLISQDTVIETAKVNKFIENVAPHKRLENFPIPTALLTLELNHGYRYLITRGAISDVIQSSYAIPYLFPPYQMKEKEFVDPGILESSPAKAAKALGAEFVIATTFTDKDDNSRYNTPEKRLNRYIEIVTEDNTKQILNNYADHVITSDVTGYSFIDFRKANQLIKIGYQDTKAKISVLKQKLKTQNIALQPPLKRKKVDLTSEFNDIKYNRILVDNLNTNLIVHYGHDYSFFKQNLIRSYQHELQYGFHVSQNHLRWTTLATNSNFQELESKVRWSKLTPGLDLISKYRLDRSRNQIDVEAGIKYYANNYTLGSGGGSINDENYFYIDHSFNLTAEKIDLAGETDVIFNDNATPKLLISDKLGYKLSETWSLEAKSIFNNTGLLASPIIYRGNKPAEQTKFQLALDCVYTYQVLSTIQLINTLRIKDIKTYLFTDYINDQESSLAYGLGIKGDFYLLGLKPFQVETYLSYDQKEDEYNTRINLNYNF